MPGHTMPAKERKRHLENQMEAFLRQEALSAVFDLLHTDRDRIGKDYNGRTAEDGRVIETQVLTPLASLEEKREELYPLLAELGFFHINKPLSECHTRILVLGGALNACFTRTNSAAAWKDRDTLSVDGLACYRPVHPKERAASVYSSACETEFGVLSDAFSEAFGLSSAGFHDDFRGDRNLNRVSCVREFSVSPGNCLYRVYAAPSSEYTLRRADTGDTFRFYLENAGVTPGDSLLAVTNNRSCNRQFLQLAGHIIKNDLPVGLDVAGCVPDGRIDTVKTFDPLLYLQDLIGILDWIGRT